MQGYENGHQAAQALTTANRRYKKIAEFYFDVAEGWRGLATRNLETAVVLDAPAASSVTGQALGQSFTATISPRLMDDGVRAVLSVSKLGADGKPQLCATYLFSLHTDVLLEDGTTVVALDHPERDFLWLAHLVKAVLST
ncbi:MAG TPA: hypothetical protein DCX26_07195 [Pseudomonas sp.]|jgi:hypothetical protein|nr:hypothetical protein [Pseudomonas sp.]|tara:strand:- start:2012 stop:2431 length:420 start_codon:yes stop_codon:yes gene_type:complete